MTISRRALVGFAGAPLLASCAPIRFGPSEAPINSEEKKERTVEVGYLRRSPTGRRLDLSHATPIGLVIASPHFDAKLVQTHIAETLPIEISREFEENVPLRAPEGSVFVLVVMQAGSPLFQETAENPVVVQLRNDTQTIQMTAMFGGIAPKAKESDPVRYKSRWECFVVCVKKESSLDLQVSDEGKVLVVDLRTGLPSDDESWRTTEGIRERRLVRVNPVDGVTQRSFEAQPPGYGPSQGTMKIGLSPQVTLMTPWNPVHGWATAGQMWLTMKMNTKVVFVDLPGTVNLDLANSFSYTSADGSPARLVKPLHINTNEIQLGRTDLIPTFEVSGQHTGAVLSFVPNGSLTVKFQEVNTITGTFTTNPEPIRFELQLVKDQSRFEE
ncbi:hypothetical protein [Tessaracoccus sp. OH4464_COT-324]|uniref:hypothetical protein n=1 Tax=Tessaracoccus sp. OH4464_COT-324 TaxID=2491059 RepID=UPI000F62F2D7|nr:hypothetical protein [Tessaracoccus sp. OH4464_COT-324]RRD46745.1 hypothetical protein EII42_05835 [Tessaracoccus sp. OH4464_COT-324]